MATFGGDRKHSSASPWTEKLESIVAWLRGCVLGDVIAASNPLADFRGASMSSDAEPRFLLLGRRFEYSQSVQIST